MAAVIADAFLVAKWLAKNPDAFKQVAAAVRTIVAEAKQLITEIEAARKPAA